MRKSINLILAITFALLATFPALAADDAKPVININTATVEQLMLLPRVGAKTAGEIVAWREKNGEFKKSTDILQVKGIGDASYELLAPYLVVSGDTTLSVKQKAPRKSKPSAPAQQ